MGDGIDGALAALMAYEQADMDGVMVTTSRQAIHEVHDEVLRLRRLIGRYADNVVAYEGTSITKQGERFVLTRDEADEVFRYLREENPGAKR